MSSLLRSFLRGDKVNKIIATLLLIIFPLTLFADELPKISPLNEGDTAPFSGVLYNEVAVAEIIAQREFLLDQHKLNLSILEDRLNAECNLKIENLQADLDVLKFKYDSMIVIKDQEIYKLQNIVIQQPNRNSHWWLTGGILSGVLFTVGIVYLLK